MAPSIRGDTKKVKKLIALSVSAAIVGGPGFLINHQAALAAGFSVPEISALGTSTANAVVANPEEKGAFAYNPAAMGFHDDTSVALGALLIGPQFSVKTGSGSHDSAGADWLAAPMIQAAFKVHEQWRAGIGINAPFGLETRWETGTFPRLTGSTPLTLPPGLTLPIPNGPQPTSSKLEVVTLVPTATYKVNEDFSVSAGLDYYKARSARLDSSLTSLTGDGDGWGWNASLLYRHDAWSLGINYHSAATVELDGNYAPLDRNLVFLNRLAPGQGLPPAQQAELDVNLPWRLQLGVRYAVNDSFAIEFDWTRTGWSQFDKLIVKSSSSGQPLLPPDINDWKDTNAYRLGLTYDVLPTTQLRFGYAYDETGQDDEHFSARVPDNDRHLFSLGVGQDLGQGWALEAGYMYVMFKDKSYRGSRPYAGLGTEINGTDAIAGDYEASANLIALEITKTF
jgi:long-chain fatty acid transport protein